MKNRSLLKFAAFISAFAVVFSIALAITGKSPVPYALLSTGFAVSAYAFFKRSRA